MAKVKFSALISDMRGKLNGSVFARNRGGAYLRTKVTPSNPQTLPQQSARGILGFFAQRWKALTELQRTGWISAVTNFSSTDVFGDIKNPSGINLFVRLNANLLNSDSSGIDDAPLPSGSGIGTTVEITVNATVPAFSLVFGTSPVPAGQKFIVEATAGQSPGKNNVKNQFRKLTVLNPADTTPADLLALYNARFGALVVGQKYFVRVKSINTVTGETGVGVVALAIAI